MPKKLKKTKSKASLDRFHNFIVSLDNIGLDVDDFYQLYVKSEKSLKEGAKGTYRKDKSEIELYWKKVYGKAPEPSTFIGYNRLASQITRLGNSEIKFLEKKNEKLEEDKFFSRNDKKQVQKIDKEIVKNRKLIDEYKEIDINQRKKVLEYIDKKFKNTGLISSYRNTRMKLIEMRIQRVRMSNQNFEDIVNGLILTYNMDRREAIEHARIIAKIPKDKIGFQNTDYITPSGLKIPKHEIKYYRNNTPSVIQYN